MLRVLLELEFSSEPPLPDIPRIQAPASAIVWLLGVHGKKRSAPTGAVGPPGIAPRLPPKSDKRMFWKIGTCGLSFLKLGEKLQIFCALEIVDEPLSTT
jgi:hypothetical protein